MNKYINKYLQIRSEPLEMREDIRFILLQLFVFFLPFDMLYSNIILLLLVITTILDIKKEKIKQIPKQIWIFQLIYFLSVIGYFYSYHKSVAGFLLERQLTIILIPVLLPLAVGINEKRKRGLLNAFILSSVLTVCLLFLNVLITIKELHLPLTGIFTKEFFNHRFSAPIGIHAGYLSLYVSLCLIYTLQLIVVTKLKKIKILLILFFVIQLAGLIFLASRNILITTILIMSFVFPFFYVKKKLLYIISITLLLVVGFIAVNNISYLKKRFTSELISDIKLTQSTDNFELTEPRIDRWQGGVRLFMRSPIIGYGTGDEISMLKTEYIKSGLYISYLEEFNAHNQYLSYLLKNGIIGLLIFLSIFIYFVYLAFKGRDYIYISFLFLLLIGFLTENILDANKGILFFAFFNTFFGYNILKKSKSIPG
ncbi:MAG: O-antigen ligase family protein [Bacteroidota bacterium]